MCLTNWGSYNTYVNAQATNTDNHIVENALDEMASRLYQSNCDSFL